MSVLEDIRNERARQVNLEGWTIDHDNDHTGEQLAAAAAAYALPELLRTYVSVRVEDPPQPSFAIDPVSGWGPFYKFIPRDWPWAAEWWKPKNRRYDLVRAAALIVAEIERLDRASVSET